MFGRFGRRYDPLHETWNLASRKFHQLTNSKCPAPAIAAAKAELDAARAALVARDVERKATRAKNKALRAQGIDPSKKPDGMTVEQFEAARSTLRAAIQPQFPDYKAELFRRLRESADRWLEKLEKANGDARAAAFEGEDVCVLREMRRKLSTWEERSLRNATDAKIERGNEWLKNIRHWSTETALPVGEHNDTNRLGAKERRKARSNASINAELDAQAQAMTERDFDSYTQKLAGKIGLPIARAHIVGNLWQSSELVVREVESFWNDTERTPTQCWSTKMILNVSCLGTLFNQWPTRRVY